MIVSGSEEAKRQLCHKVGGDRRFSVVGEAATPDAAVALAAGDLPDLVLVHLVQLEPRALAQLAGLGGWSPRTALVLVSGIDVSRAGDLLVTSTVAEDWPFAQLAPTVAPPGGNGDHPRRATAELPAPARAVPPPRRSIIHEAMRQIGVPMRRKQ